MLSIGVVPDRTSNENSNVFFGNVGHGLRYYVYIACSRHKDKAGVQSCGPVVPRTNRWATGKDLMDTKVRSIDFSRPSRFTRISELVVHHVTDKVSTVVIFRLHVRIPAYLLDVFVDEFI